MSTLQRISPNLWFDTQAEEAARFYTSIFPNSHIGRITHYGKEGIDVHGLPEGTVLTVEFWLNGQPFTALNGGPHFKFTEATSFIIHCMDQDELDLYWEKLSEGGDRKAQQCGWLKDKFGLSWQVVPAIMGDLLQDADRTRADRVMKAMLQMKKLDIVTLQNAYEGNRSQYA